MGFAGYLNPFPDKEPERDPVEEMINPVQHAVYTPQKHEIQSFQPVREDKEKQLLEDKVDQLQQKLDEIEKAEHPLKMLELHIGGFLIGGGKHLYHIVASQNGQKVFDTNSNELQEMGYSLERRTSCLLGLTYEKYHHWITCDAPRVGVKFKGRQG